jgi:hypothetical protein
MNDPIVDVTTNISIYTQLSVALIDFYALSVSVPEEHMILKDILLLEVVVQIIEFIWYVFVIQHLPQEEMAKNRYYDWIITTPLMLVSMFFYFLYEEKLEKNPNDPPIRISSIIKNHAESITQIILSNLAMLSVGYLYEIGKLSKEIAFAYGFVFLVNTFSIIYLKAGSKSNKGIIISIIMFLVWSIYGVAFILPTAIKNSIFNITDLFSKNFFELYIAILAFQKSN